MVLCDRPDCFIFYRLAFGNSESRSPGQFYGLFEQNIVMEIFYYNIIIIGFVIRND